MNREPPTSPSPVRPSYVGRGAVVDPPNRFERVRLEADLAQLAEDELPSGPRKLRTQLLPDTTRSIIASNDSPDVPFRYSINPYRGCEHGCAYCYARPSHELLGMNAGIDFESKVLVKHAAPQLLREALSRPNWRGEVIAMSGVTDCYQPAERRLQITRGCLQVLLESRQPVSIITKNALVVRDIDLLQGLAEQNLVRVTLSVTTLSSELARTMEPRTASPAARLRAIAALSSAGVPTGVMVAPVVPGLNDHEIPRILTAAARAGACVAGYQLLRLPLSVLPVFLGYLQTHLPEARARIESRIRSSRGGQLTNAEFGRRMCGEGPYARNIHNTFKAFAHKLGLDRELRELDSSQFRPPKAANGQQWLF